MTTEEHPTAGDHRVRFDFEIDFSNGGGIQGQGLGAATPPAQAGQYPAGWRIPS
jgi:hypothetical protein